MVRIYWGRTQSDIANSLGVSQGYISEIEKGKKEVTIELLRKYSNELNIPMSTLMLFAEQIDDTGKINKGRIFLADAALAILRKIVPHDYEKEH